MPLQFESISHGPIAFGFFNIETDMILLNHYFFFAEDFCSFVSETAQKPSLEILETCLDIYRIEERKIGNLMGAIEGVDHSGFIGETYRRFPFPKERTGFKQKPDGLARRTDIEKMIHEYGKKSTILIVIDQREDRIAIGEFIFSRSSFQELIRYVWLGGFPRWKDDIKPDYVLSMKAAIEASENFPFKGFTL